MQRWIFCEILKRYCHAVHVVFCTVQCDTWELVVIRVIQSVTEKPVMWHEQPPQHRAVYTVTCINSRSESILITYDTPTQHSKICNNRSMSVILVTKATMAQMVVSETDQLVPEQRQILHYGFVGQIFRNMNNTDDEWDQRGIHSCLNNSAQKQTSWIQEVCP